MCLQHPAGAAAGSVTFELPACSFVERSSTPGEVAPESADDDKKKDVEKKCELVEFDSLPEYLKDNEFIVGYYRCEWPLKETLLSVFSIHNETLNVWTYVAACVNQICSPLIGFLIFLSLTVLTSMVMPKDAVGDVGANAIPAAPPCMLKNQTRSGVVVPRISFPEAVAEVANEMEEQQYISPPMPPSLDRQVGDVLLSCLPDLFFSQRSNLTRPCVCQQNQSEEKAGTLDVIMDPVVVESNPAPSTVTRWPFFAFLCGAMFCLLTSSVCHLVSCHSATTAYVMLRLDYAGITALIVTSFCPLVYYSFMCDPLYRDLYMGFITAFGAAAVTVSLVPVFQTPEFRPARAGLFFCMALSGVVPIMHKVIAYGHRPEAIVSTGYELLMGVFYGLGVVVYATRIPEAWIPGRFDLVGHSHQLFHVLVIAGAYTHYLAGLVYLQWRSSEGC